MTHTALTQIGQRTHHLLEVTRLTTDAAGDLLVDGVWVSNHGVYLAVVRASAVIVPVDHP